MGVTLDHYITYGVDYTSITDEMLWSLYDYLVAHGVKTDNVTVHTLCTTEKFVTVDSIVRHIVCVQRGASRIFYTYKHFKWTVLPPQMDELTVTRHGMTAYEVNSIRPQAWEQILEGADSLELNSYFSSPIANQVSSTGLTISRMELAFKPEILTAPAMCRTQTFKTSMWKKINKLSVQEYLSENSRIRYSVYSDKLGKSCIWSKRMKKWLTAPADDLSMLSDGMTKQDIEGLPKEALEAILGTELSFNAVIQAETPGAFCQFFCVIADHEKYPSIMRSNSMHSMPTDTVYQQYGWDYNIDTYVLENVEGVGFENAASEDDFYTTPNKIVLKAMPLGTLIGTRQSIIYKCELANTYKSRYLHVKLTANYGGLNAVDMGDGSCKFQDAENLEFATKCELSFSGPDNFVAEYPLEFDVKPLSDNLFYFRLTPTLTTVGEVNAQIIAVTSEISEEEYKAGRPK